jgi:hypothetical protein
MFQLDEKFLEEVGLGEMYDEQKKAFLQHLYDELELRVGTKLSEGMSEQQLKDFESIIDRKEDFVVSWIESNAPDFSQDELFAKLKQASGLEAGDINLRAEYAATKWLEINRPDYRDVVASVMEQLKQEVSQSKDKILNS